MPADIIALKIERAEKHIDEFDRELAVWFHDVKPYHLGFKNDTNKRESVLYVKRATEISPALSIILGDAISNLYSCLDYLACELVTSEHCISAKTAFPISEHVPTSKDQKARYEGQVRGMRDDVKRLIEGLEPYRGRGNNLWTLHTLNNINKHRTIVTIANGAAIITPSGEWNVHVALKEGAELLRVSSDLPDKDKIKLMPLIVINEPKADVINHPPLTVLRGCLRDAKRITALLKPHRRAHMRRASPQI